MEELCYEYFRRIDELGGMVQAVKDGYPQREIADAAFELQREIDSGRRIVVGVNSHTEGDGDETQSCASTRRSNASRSNGFAPSKRAGTASR
jgi:methylmalonyl-CoA mutase N-terminal domain/subunit